MTHTENVEEMGARVMRDRRVRRKRREVYFVKAERLELIKIGVSNDALIRVPHLQMMSPDRLELLGVMFCEEYGALEQAIQARFREHRSHGEWFHAVPELTDFIEANATPADAIPRARLDARGTPYEIIDGDAFSRLGELAA